MKKLTKACDIFGNIICVISVLALVTMIVLVVADVFLKELFKAPITGAVELTRMMMICMTPAFIPTLLRNRHVSVGVFIDKLGKYGQLVFDIFGYLMSAVLCALMCYQGLLEASRRMAQKQVYTMLKYPTWPFYTVLAVSMGLFSLMIVIILVGKFINTFKTAPYEQANGSKTDGGAGA